MTEVNGQALSDEESCYQDHEKASPVASRYEKNQRQKDIKLFFNGQSPEMAGQPPASGRVKSVRAAVEEIAHSDKRGGDASPLLV